MKWRTVFKKFFSSFSPLKFGLCHKIVSGFFLSLKRQVQFLLSLYLVITDSKWIEPQFSVTVFGLKNWFKYKMIL